MLDLTDPNDSLSVWSYADDPGLEEVVVAVAVTRQRLDRLDILGIPEELCGELNIRVEETSGQTSYGAARSRHRDLANLSVTQVASLTRSLRQNSNVRRFAETDILALLVPRMKNGDPQLSDLSPKVIEELFRRRLWDQSECLEALAEAVASGRIKSEGLRDKTRKAIDRHTSA